MRRLAIAALVGLAACGPYPRDIDGTFERIERTHTFTVGFADLDPDDVPVADRFVARIESETGAKATITRGPTENQLARLESGQLDLVIGEFAEDTPWVADVSILEPLVRRPAGERTLGLAPVAANGENRWIGLLEREIRNWTEGRGA